MKILSKFKILPLFFLIIGGCCFSAASSFSPLGFSNSFSSSFTSAFSSSGASGASGGGGSAGGGGGAG